MKWTVDIFLSLYIPMGFRREIRNDICRFLCFFFFLLLVPLNLYLSFFLFFPIPPYISPSLKFGYGKLPQPFICSYYYYFTRKINILFLMFCGMKAESKTASVKHMLADTTHFQLPPSRALPRACLSLSP